ncbi:F-box/LRR-repeat protein 13-like isoform X1 [Lingula anatina]|uniref:F-box/LRR-repeat protein 13-like isoform X1 n=1 Tax=Lingula anatina TaxID=7574 RepID=A0A1S3JNE8_LINAN|nr:F-box/LRR-repeat protein 13-like isoform X1 [Lingula anatina]|eukprot:XP_013411676.1 F-box/LRR-repeat protein 13-like isoform X1 [Lingula anatina]
MAASLKGIDPELKKYLRINRLPDVYEALLTGLAVMCPDDPKAFIVKCLRHIQKYGLRCLQWDMFVEEEMRPRRRVITESNLDYIFNLDDYSLQPTPEMYAKAFSFYNSRLRSMCFHGWMQFHLVKKQKRMDMERKWCEAVTHYAHRLMRLALNEWTQWMNFRKGVQSMAYNKIQRVFFCAIAKVIFDNWHEETTKARRTREYFEINIRRLERGENMEEEDPTGRGLGDARDDISANMPRSVALKIFSYVDIDDLARCAQVCRSWKILTQSHSLWTRLDLSIVRGRLSTGVTDHVVKTLLTKCRPYIVHLNLRGCLRLSRAAFVTISECRNLQDLNLSECSAVNDSSMKLVCEGCTILLYLNISHTNITDATLRLISKSMENLQYLSLAFCKRFTDKGLQYLAMGKGGAKLQWLDMSGCTQISVIGFENLATGCTSLRSVILNEFQNLSDDRIIALTETCKNLTYVSVLGSPYISDESLKKVAATRKLRMLKIDSNQKITDVSFKMIGRMCPDLYHLYLTDCQKITDMTLKSLSSCKNLTVLNLADCVRISDNGVKSIVESSCGPKLKELNLTNCIRVGDIALVHIHKRCMSLTYLSVCFCEHISEAGIELLGQTTSLVCLDISGCRCADQGLSALGNNPRFRDVCLSDCNGISDLGLQKFSQQCKDVERLDLSFCQLVTDAAIKNLAFCCRMLTVLNLAGCKLLTDLSIQYLSGVCHYMTNLDLSGCVLITDKALRYLRKGCKKMKMLLLLYCKGISKQAAQKCMRQIPFVQWNDDEVPADFC